MKTIGKHWGAKLVTYATVFGFLTFTSCEDRIDFDSNDSENVENEAATDSYFEDTDDMSTLAVSAEGGAVSGGRDASSGRNGVKPSDLRFTCATVTFEFASDNSTTTPHGYITIDFGTGCTDTRGNVRKGKIKVEFKGRRFLPGGTIITTLEGYSINGVALEGVRTVTNIAGSTEDNPKFNITLVGGKATWTVDGTVKTATREVNRTREWVRATNPANDQWIVSGTAAGTNREGRVYEMTITKNLVYKRECALSERVFIAVEGTKELVVNGKKIVIDYGTGTCDRLVTITVNGKSKEVRVRGEI
ncbi:MAG: hypothetical protein ACOYW3_15920 [Bacteroidota bacterium]